MSSGRTKEEATRKEEPGESEPPAWRRARELSDLGERAYRQENYGAAQRHFRAALELAPENLYALTGLGWTLYDSGRHDEAYPVFRHAYELSPSDGSARRGLGYLLYRYGRPWEARVMLGTLDAERWPELANIDDQLRDLKRRGLPMPSAPDGGLLGSRSPVRQPVSTEAKPLRAATSSSLAVEKSSLAPPPGRTPSFRNMVLIPGGSYVMGATSDARNGRRRKAEVVTVPSFRLDKFEVTNAQYAAFIAKSGRPEPPFWRHPHFAGPHRPVVGVTWREARDYCIWAGKRLPTEIEWEYAARGGKEGRFYPWGNRFEDRNAVFGLRPDDGGPKEVGRRPDGASAHGVEDLAGNVWEWTADAFRKSPGSPELVRREGQVYRTLRGGSWVNGRWALAVTSRTGDLPTRRLPVYGFRCAADAP